MRKGRLILLIIIILLIIAGEIYVMSRCTRQAAEVSEPEPTPTATPILLTPTPAPTAEPTEAPAAVEEPTEEPASAETSGEVDAEEASEEPKDESAEETPSPTDTPEPSASPDPSASSEAAAPVPTDIPYFAESSEYGTLINKGSFSSNTGLTLNLNIFWAAYDNGTDNIQLHLIGTLSSGNVQHGPHSYGATIEYAGNTTYAATNTVIVTSYSLVESDLFDTVITVPKGTEDTMSVSFDYGGTYSGVYTPTITATGTVLADLPDDGTVHYTSEHD